MKALVVDTLDKVKHLEESIKEHIGYAVPKCITRTIALLIVQSHSATVAYSKIDKYLMKVYQDRLIGNAKLISTIQRSFSEQGHIDFYRQTLQKIDCEKFAAEKNILLGEERNDRYEFSGARNKTLAKILEKGIKVQIDAEALRKLIALIGNAQNKLLTDYLKKYRILKINNFADSKVSHLIHDVFDHMYFFRELSQVKFFESSSDFRQMVGNPHMRDIFSRESELIASVAYERRDYVQYENYFNLALKDEYIISLIDKNFLEKEKEAYREKVNFISAHSVSVYHIYYNVLCELAEQIRKVGTIKLINELGEQKGNITSLLNNKYLKIIIDILFFVTHSQKRFKKSLCKTYTYIESLLHEAAQSKDEIYYATITLESLQRYKCDKGYAKYIRTIFNL